MRTLLLTLGFLLATVAVTPRPASGHWASLAPPPYPYPYVPYVAPVYPGYIASPYAPCVVGPAGPICTSGVYDPGWQYRREWDTDFIWRNSGPHVRGYTLH